MNVPAKEYARTDPIFLKNGFFCILYPLSNIIGGRRTIMKSCTKFSETFSSVPLMLIRRNNPAVIRPIRVVSPASCKYLCFDFFKWCPQEIANISRKIMQRISVDTCKLLRSKIGIKITYCVFTLIRFWLRLNVLLVILSIVFCPRILTCQYLKAGLKHNIVYIFATLILKPFLIV